MNNWYSLGNGAAAQAWGTALLHFLWQGALLALFAWAALRGVEETRPRLRYALACLFLALMALAPLVTLAAVWPAPAALPPVSAVLPPEPPPSSGAPLPAAPLPLPWSLWASALWLAGSALFTLRALGGWGLAWHEQRQSRFAPPEAWREAAARLARALALPRPVRLFASRRLSAPQVFGYLRPVVLLPAAALTGLSPRQIEAILAHELAHVARHDALVNYLQTAVEALLFFHPAVWWLSRRVREEREACCDEFAARWCGDRAVYGRALLAFEEMRAGFALAASAGPLSRRIHRLLAPQAAGQPFWLAALLCLALVAAAAASVDEPQPPKKPSPAAAPAPAAAPKPAASAAPAAAPRPAAKPTPATAAQLAELEKQVRELEFHRQELLNRQAELDRKRFELGVITTEELARSELAAAKAAGDSARTREIAERMLKRAQRELELGVSSALDFQKTEAAAQEAMLQAALDERRAELRKKGRGDETAAKVEELRYRLALLELERNRSAAERDAERAEAERRVSELRTEEARRIRELELAARQREAETPYRRWLEQDVVYIIAHEEKAAFERLKTDEERAKFIEQFWQRRDPTPAAAPNEFKEEHYRRIAYANERFRTGEVHGWRTDRGRIYIVNGPPDEIETHPGSREAWRYKSGLRTFEFTLPGGVLKGIAVPLGR